jgi:hypothetical protein
LTGTVTLTLNATTGLLTPSITGGNQASGTVNWAWTGAGLNATFVPGDNGAALPLTKYDLNKEIICTYTGSAGLKGTISGTVYVSQIAFTNTPDSSETTQCSPANNAYVKNGDTVTLTHDGDGQGKNVSVKVNGSTRATLGATTPVAPGTTKTFVINRTTDADSTSGKIVILAEWS